MTALLFAVCGMTWAEEAIFEPANFTAVSQQSFTIDSNGITVKSSNGAITDSQFRFYANSTLSFSASAGNITKIEITCTANGTAQYGPGKITGTDYSYSDNVGTWTGNSASVTLNASAQVRATKIVVTYTAGKKTANVSIDKVKLLKGEAATITTDGPALSLSSDDTSVATVDGNVVTAVGKGETIITATWDGNEEFNSGSKSFNVTVRDPIAAEDGVFDFTFENDINYGNDLYPRKDYSSTEYTTSSTWVAGNVTMEISGNHRWWIKTSNGEDSYELRVFSNASATISVPEGYVIKTIQATGSSLGVLTDANNKSISSWTGAAQSVEFTSSGTAQIKTITVTYQEAGEKADATVTIGQTSLKVGQTTTVSTDGPALTLSTDDASVASVSGNTITAVGAGTATITATWEENNEFKGGTETFEVTVTAAGTVVDGFFDFSYDDGIDYGSGLTPKNSNEYGNDYEESSTWVAGNVTMNVEGNHRWWSASAGNQLRIFNGCTATISVPNGYVITKIETTGKNLNLLKDANANSISSWTGSSQTVEFNHGGGSGVQIETLTVTYEEEAAPASITVSIPASGYASFCSQYAIEVEEDGVAFIATGLNNGKVRLQPVTGVIAKETGLIIKGSGSVDLAVSSEEGEAPEGNKLVGVLTATDMTGIECYILKDGAFWPCTGGTLAAGKAYLDIAPETVGGGTEGKILDIEEGIIDPTAISEIETTTENAAIYTLGGVRVKDAQQKGIYIINGKKVVK